MNLFFRKSKPQPTIDWPFISVKTLRGQMPFDKPSVERRVISEMRIKSKIADDITTDQLKIIREINYGVRNLACFAGSQQKLLSGEVFDTASSDIARLLIKVPKTIGFQRLLEEKARDGLRSLFVINYLSEYPRAIRPFNWVRQQILQAAEAQEFPAYLLEPEKQINPCIVKRYPRVVETLNRTAGELEPIKSYELWSAINFISENTNCLDLVDFKDEPKNSSLQEVSNEIH